MNETQDSAVILVVDDEPDLRDTLAEALRARGHTVHTAANDKDGLAVLANENIDLLLTDLMMPGLSGIDLMAQALQIDPHLITILMTGHATVQTAVDAMKQGAFDYLMKPFKLAQLTPTLEHGLALRRLRQENVQLRETVALHELTRAIAASLDLETILQRVADAARQQCADDEVSIMLPAAEGQWRIATAAGSEHHQQLVGRETPLGKTITGWVVAQREPVTLHGPIDDQRFSPLHPRNEVVSAICLPLELGGRVVGVLCINATRRARPFTPGEVKALNIIGGMAAQALDGARLIRELQEANIQLHAALEQVRASQSQMVQQERLRALGQMASGIAHDFNNALGPILGFSEIMLMNEKNLDDRAKVKRNLEIMNTAARDAASIVGRLREFYRQRDESDTFLPVDLIQVVEQAIALTQPKWKDQAQAGGVSITIVPELNKIPLIPGDAAELRELLTNLIFNAVDAMPEGGVITIRTDVSDGAGTGGRGDEEEHPVSPSSHPRVVLSVQDTGTGMAEEARGRCLEPFFSTKGEQGSGLGLAMAVGIVDRHEGTIAVDSELGKGTRLTIRLPVAEVTEFRAHESSVVPVRLLRLLVVDDDPLLRDALREYLEHDGHSVEVADSGLEALEQLRAGRFDAVLTDRAMPGMSGDVLAATIHECDPTVPVIMVTGFGDLMKHAGELPSGVASIVSKPVTIAALRKALAEAVK